MFAPLVPKAEGYRSLALDVFDRAELLRRARGDDDIPEEGHDRIEEVDLVGGAMDGPSGCEFYTRLVRGVPPPTKSAFESLRAELLEKVVDEGASNSRQATALMRTIAEEAAIKVLEARLAALKAAPSWRLTAPLRLLHPFFGER